MSRNEVEGIKLETLRVNPGKAGKVDHRAIFKSENEHFYSRNDSACRNN